MWDAATGQELLTLEGPHRRRAVAWRYSPDGSRIASGSRDKTVKVWDAARARTAHPQGHTSCVLPWRSAPTAHASPRAATDRTVKVWDAGTGQELLTLGAHGAVMRVAFSPDGSRIASGS